VSLVVLVITLVLLFGCRRGHYANRYYGYYGSAGLGGMLGTVLVVAVLWLLGR
jgi:hypothetical protein